MSIVALLALPLVSSLVVMLLKGKWASRGALLLSLASLLLAVVFYVDFRAGNYTPVTFIKPWISDPFVNFSLLVDGISLLMILLTNILVPLIILSGFGNQHHRPNVFYGLVLLMQFALLGVFTAADGFLYYIFWELALIPIYFIALNWGGANRVKVTLKFFIYTIAGSLFMLIGFIFLYLQVPGQHSFDIQAFYNLALTAKEQGWIFGAFFLAFAIKIPIVPFHTWQPDTYKEAPTQGTMLLSGIMLKMGTYSLIRWLIPVVPEGVAAWGPWAIGLSVAGIVYASILAIMQKDLKKLFAYSSIAHVGLIAAGIFAWNHQGLQGSLIQMLSHGINVIGIFFCAEIIMRRTQTNNITSLGGIRAQAPVFASCFLILVLGSVALPLTNGFIGEFLLLYGVYEYNTWLSVVAGLTIILGAVYMLRMFQYTMLGEQKIQVFADLDRNEKAVLFPLVALVLLIGVYPQPILEMTEPAVKLILGN